MAGNNRFFLLIDLTNTSPPSVESRRALKHNFNSFGNQLVAIFIFSGKNKFINMAVKFVHSSAGLKNFMMFTTKEEALNSIPRK